MGEIFRNATLSNFDAFLTLSDYKSKRGQAGQPSAACAAAEGGVKLTPRDQRAAFRHSQQRPAEPSRDRRRRGGASDLSVIISIPGSRGRRETDIVFAPEILTTDCMNCV